MCNNTREYVLNSYLKAYMCINALKLWRHFFTFFNMSLNPMLCKCLAINKSFKKHSCTMEERKV